MNSISSEVQAGNLADKIRLAKFVLTNGNGY